MSDINYNIITEDDERNDVVFTVNDYYNNCEIYKVCTPSGGTPLSNYTIVNDKEEKKEDLFYNVDYTV